MLYPFSDDDLDIMLRLSRYLNVRSDAITGADICELCESCGISADQAMFMLVSAYLGLEMADNMHDAALAEEYVRPGLKKVSAVEYAKDAYYTDIHMPEAVHGRWKLTNLKYKPYELFVRDEPYFDSEGRQVPRTGYFDTEFSYPAVLEDGREWMTVTPEETDTQQVAIDAARGRVCTLGLGLGYYAFQASMKPEVTSVTVIERDKDVIGLFEKYILPQFPHREKINIICGDAFDYVEHTAPVEHFDVLFADIWHDVADGTVMYLKLKRLEQGLTGTKVYYWIETSILMWLRGMAAQEQEDGGGLISGALGSYGREVSLDELRLKAHLIPLEITDGFERTGR